MVFRKKSKLEKVEDRIKKLEELEEDYLSLAKKYGKEDHPSKGRDATMTAGICRTKIIELNKILDDLKTTEQGSGDMTVPFTEETCSRFLKWLRKEDEGYFRFLQLIKINPDVLKIILAVDLDKPFPKFELKEKK